ncbi:metalloendopeptidase [Trichonephila clavipes]|nr:metalloendopeptidase [Trichonephila clavipes]
MSEQPNKFQQPKLGNILLDKYGSKIECPNKANLHCQNDGYRSPYQGNSKPCTCICPPNTKGKKCETVTGDYYGSITCGGDVLTEGVIQSPGYPGRNPNDSCTWQIKAPIRKKVQVTFEDFSFRPRMNKPSNNYNGLCVYEHVEIRTSNMEEGDFWLVVKNSFYTAGIAVILFSPYGGSERVKRHRALPMELASVFHKYVSFSMHVLGLSISGTPKMSAIYSSIAIDLSYCDEDIPKGTQMESSSNTFLIIIRADTKGEGRGFKASVKFI